MLEPPAWARPEVHAELLADLAAPRHPSDGQGAVRWVGEAPRVQVGAAGCFELLLTLGPLGIAPGGAISFQPPPFWGWSPPQAHAPGEPGYTVLEVDGAALAAHAPQAGLLLAQVGAPGLPGGSEVRIGYGVPEGGCGAGPGLARVDRFAGGGDAFWIGVDGDGDGVRGLLAEPLPVQVLPGPPARLLAWLPSTAAPGEEALLRLAWVDAAGNRAAGEAELRLEGPSWLGLPERALLQDGVATVRFTPREEGVATALATALAPAGEGLEPARSNPLLVRAGAPRLLWGDLQVHTALSDGSATPAEALAYARDVAGLDLAAITDHDHWGMRPLARHPASWEQVLAAVRAATGPGFLAIPGYEWTSWRWGHRHVLFFGPPGPLWSALDAATDTPAELWAALRGQPALTLAHHSAGGPIATDWRWTPDPMLEPVTELCSVHGSSEAPDSPGLIYSPVAGNTVREQLARGLRLGFVCSTDGHDGHPGLAQLAAGHGGLAGLWAESLTPEAVLEALRARRVYGTNGARILLRTTLGGLPMGAALPAPAGPLTLEVRVLAPAPVTVVELIRGAEVVARQVGGEPALRVELPLEDLRPGELVYVRVRDQAGGVAWSSPYFFE